MQVAIGLIDRAIDNHSNFGYYLHWFHQQTNPDELQIQYSYLSMYLSQQIGGLYKDLDYQGEEPLVLDYGFVADWDIWLRARVPDPTLTHYQQALERNDYLPSKEHAWLKHYHP